jgi:F-type H+-transporting ATPase subunit epsilon
MATFKFELVSPERLLMSEDVEQVVVPGSDGDFGVLAGHAPFVSTLRPGVLEVHKANGEKTRVFVLGGFAEVDPKSLTILAQQATNVADLNAESFAQQIKVAQQDVADAKDDANRQRTQEVLDRLRELEGTLRVA